MSASIALPSHEISQCYHCGLQAVQPKLLPCQHTFCLQCLESEAQRLERSPGGHRMACPECSSEFMVPPQGLSGLPPDTCVEQPVTIQKQDQCDECSNDHTCVCARVSSAVPRRARFDTRGKEAWGVTWMKDCIYILTEDSVLAYEAENPSSPVDEVDIPEKKYLTDIAASSVNSCLYITDAGDINARNKESSIWKIESDTCRISRWQRVTFKLMTLSVSPNGNVTVSVSAKDRNRLTVYGKDGSQMKAISLPYNFPNHAIELANGNFIVVFGKIDASRHDVLEINGSGKVVRSICDNEVLNHPWYVTVFGNKEIGLLLADSKNNRVLWLDSCLKIKMELLTKEKDGIIEPRRMCYAEQSNLLMIVHSEDGRRVVDLYDGSRWLN